MIPELALATIMVLLTVAIHAAGLYALSRLLRLEEQKRRRSAFIPCRCAVLRQR